MTAPARRFPRVFDALVALAVAVLYIAFAKLGFALAVRAAQVSAVWPPTGFAIAVLLLAGRRATPGILIGALISNATAGEPLWVAAGISVGNTLEAMIGAAILRRYDFNAALMRLRDVLALMAAVALSPLVSATIGVAFLTLGAVHPPSAAPALWLVWWLGDTLGGLIVAPLILVWSRSDPVRQQAGFVEPALMLISVAIAAVAVFSQPFPIAYIVYPFFIWSALRLGPAFTTTAALVVSAIAVAGTLSGQGPFARAGPEQGLVLVQIFMAVGATTALILGAVAAQSRLAHDRAELSEQRLRVTMAGARVGVWDWNIATGEITWSEGLEPLHGLRQGTFPGTYEAYLKTIHPDDLERVESLIGKSVETRAPFEAEFRLLGPDGVVRWTSARAIVIDDGGGQASRMVGVGIEVTHLKKLEEDLRLQHRRKDEFLAMLGHELRNPLAAIVHAIDALSSPARDESEEARRVIRRQANNLSRLVDDLLDMSRIASGKIEIERRVVAVSAVVTAGVDVWRHLIAQKRQQLTIDMPQTPLRVEGDPMRLAQLIANLVHNAAKFTPDEGTITITAAEENGNAVVRVRDSGQGMPPDVLAHAFELFMQGPRTLDRNLGGLGLGLTLVQRLVELHGGSVEATSPGLDRGSEVILRLPLTTRSEETPSRAARASDSAARPRRVLVVEDNEDVRKMLVFLLKRDGHEVRSAHDGPSGVAEAESFAPEIVLVDVGLPELDGYAVARRLRASPRTANALLIALTGYGQEDDRQKAFAAGFDHHLLKPVEPQRVLELMREERRTSS